MKNLGTLCTIVCSCIGGYLLFNDIVRTCTLLGMRMIIIRGVHGPGWRDNPTQPETFVIICIKFIKFKFGRSLTRMLMSLD